jgi:hypothetical protein
MSMQKPRNVDEYLELIACADDEGDGDNEFTAMTPVLREIEAGLRALHAEIVRGGYTMGLGEDLPFMKLVFPVRRRLPITGLLENINLAHKRGFGK